jgi:cell division protease FtsH
MVCELGMSDKMGPLTYGTKEEQVFLGKDFSSQKNFSDQTAKLIDQEVKALVMGGYNKAKELLTGNLKHLENIAQALLERETLNLKEIKEIVFGKKDSDDESGTPEISDTPSAPASNPVEKKKDDDDSREGLLGGGMPDPHPA